MVLQLPKLLDDGCVLQAGATIHIWGTGDPGRGVSEVGFALGFSDPSAFHKAFVRWTGSSPGQWRRARRAT